MTEKLKLKNNLSDEELDVDLETSSELEEEENEYERYEKDSLEYDPEKINIATREPTIEQLLRRIDEDALDLAPDFQRHANL